MPRKLPVRVKPLGEYTQAEVSTSGVTAVGDSKPQLGTALPNTLTEPLSQGFIVRTLEGLEFPPEPVGPSVTVCTFDDLQDQIGSVVRVLFTVDEPSIFRVMAGVGLRVPAAKVPSALRACSSYWGHFSFGRVGLVFKEGTDEGSLIFDSQILLLHGTSEQFLESFIMSNVGNAIAFFQHAWDQGLYTACQLKRSRKNGKRSEPKGGKA
jgi:hypothetical protein